MSVTPSQYGAAAEESAASSSPSSPEPIGDDDADSFVIQSNESQSSLGATSSRASSADPHDRRMRPKAPVEGLPPELLIIILQKLSSPHDLYHCVLVCKKWARCAIDLLWHRPLFTDWDKLTKVAHAIQDPESFWPYSDLVKRLNLSNLNTGSSSSMSHNVINDGTLQPFANCKRIERLTLTSCSSLTDQGIMSLVEGNSNLLALDISGISFITDETIQALAKNCPKLQGLNITSCSSVTDASLVPLARACKYLKRLKLNKCQNLTDASIEAFALKCPSMLEIDLQSCDLVTDPSITALLQGSRQLRELRLAMCQKVTDHAFLSLPSAAKFDSLRILDLTSCVQLTDNAVEKIIDSAPRLRILVLAKCFDITDRSVFAISKLGKNLHDIHLGRCIQITDEALKELVTKCNRIRYIDLAGCTRVTDNSVKMLANLPKLRRIGLVKCQNITDASIRALARGNSGHAPPSGRSQLSSSLERVHLSYCVNITLDGVNELLRKCPKLTHLSLTGIQAFYQRDDLVAFCRDAPSEFNDEQRMVFCVFSGDGVHKLRNHLSRDPPLYSNDDISMLDDSPDSDDNVAADVPVPTVLQYPLSAPPYTTQAPPYPNIPVQHQQQPLPGSRTTQQFFVPSSSLHGPSLAGSNWPGFPTQYSPSSSQPNSQAPQYLTMQEAAIPSHQGFHQPSAYVYCPNLALHPGPPGEGPSYARGESSYREDPHASRNQHPQIKDEEEFEEQ